MYSSTVINTTVINEEKILKVITIASTGLCASQILLYFRRSRTLKLKSITRIRILLGAASRLDYSYYYYNKPNT